MKTKKLFNKMVVIILGMLLLAGIGVSVNRVVRNNVNTKVIGSNIGEYVAVQSGDDAIAGTNFVTFDAYFLKNGQKVRGAYLPFTKKEPYGHDVVSTELWMELKVLSNGTLKNGQIVFTRDNVEETFALIEDDFVKADAVGNNIPSVSLKDIPTGTTKLFKIKVAANLNKFFSNENKVKLVGNHVDNDGIVTRIEKEVNFSIDTSVDNAVAMNEVVVKSGWDKMRYGKKSITNNDGDVFIPYGFNVNYGTYKSGESQVEGLSLKEGVLEGEINAINGVYPEEISLTPNPSYLYPAFNSNEYVIEYNKSNGKYKIRFITPKKFNRSINIYILTKYLKGSVNLDVNHVFNMKSIAYAIVNNNEKLNNPIISEKIEVLDSIEYLAMPKKNEARIYIYPPTKDIPLTKYDGGEVDKNLEKWKVVWMPIINNDNGRKEVVLYQDIDRVDYLTQNYDNLSGAVNVDNNVVNTAVSIDYRGEVSDDARIELYDNDTGALIHSFSKNEIEYSWNNIYKLEPNIKHLKYVIKNIDLYSDRNVLQLYNHKTINNNDLVANISKEKFDKLNWISTGYTMKMESENLSIRGPAKYDETNRVKVSFFALLERNDYNLNDPVSKIGAIKAFSGIDGVEDLYYTNWTIKSENRREETLQITSKDSEKFINVNGNVVEGVYSKYHGIQFSESPRILLGEDGWIKIYNNETNELIAVFNNSNWDNYISNPYIYGTDIKDIKVITSKIVDRAKLYIKNVMKIDDELVKNNISKSEFDKISYIGKNLEYSSKLSVNSSEFTGKGKESINVEYYNVKSFARSDKSILLSSYKSMNVSLKFSLNTLSFYHNNNNFIGESWKKSIVLMELPKDIVDIEIGNINIANANVLGHEIIDKDGKKFIKIYLDSDHFVREQDIDITANITVDPLVDTKETVIKVYALNEVNVDYTYIVNDRFVDLNDKKDIYDIDGDNNRDERVAYTEIKTKIIAPDDLHVNQKIVDYNTAGDVVNAPNVGIIDGNGTGKAKVVIQLKNNYSPAITDVRLAGAIPFEGNKGLLTGNDFNSKNTTIMTGPIKVPEDLKNEVKVYYSENLEISNTNKSWVDPANNWKLAEDVTDWTKIKHYYIDFGNKVINLNEVKEFSYEVKMPQNVTYNNPTYASVAFTANLKTNEGRLFTSGEANKVGLQLLKRFNLEIESNKLNSEYKIGGTSYSIKTDDNIDNKVVRTNNEGRVEATGLLLDKEYIVEKIGMDENYLGDNSKVRFKVIESNGNRILQFIDGENKVASSEIIQPTVDTLTKVNFKFSYISKYNFTLNKVDVENNQPLMGISYSLYEGEQLIKTSGTGKNGSILFKGLTPGLEYTLKEVRADGYYLNEPFKFKVVNTDGNPTIVKLSGNGEDLVINKSNNGLDEASVKFTNLRAKKYSIDITKYVKGKEQKLAGAGFMVTGNDFVTGKVAETDENGHLVINNLYEYKLGQSYSGEYTIEEIAAPSGYTRNAGKLKIKAQRNNAGILEVSIIEDTLTRTINSGKDIVLEGADTDNSVYKIGVEDSPLFTIIKTDAKTGDRLPKTKFAIYEVNDDGSEGVAYDSKGNIVGNDEEINGVRYRVIETDENGEYTKDLKPGKYKFIELSTVDKKYEISKDPILVNIGKQVQPKYGWTEGTVQNGIEEYYKKYPNTNFAILPRAWGGVGVHTEEVEYRKEEIRRSGYDTPKVYWSTYGRYKAMGVYSRYSWDDKVVLIRDLTEGNKRFVVLDINTGAEIKSIPMENDSEQIVSAKIIYNGVTKKYKVYDDDYNVLFEFQREGDILYGVSSLKKVGNNYYIQILGDERRGRNIVGSKLLKFDNSMNLIKEYDNSVLTDDNNIMKVEWAESQVNWMSNFKFIIKLYDLEENLISESEPVNIEMGKPYFEVLRNGDILPETFRYYKFGITVPAEEPVSEINVKNNWKKFNIKAKYSPNGSITDITASDVDWKTLEELEINSNSNKEIKITPDAGFKITKVLVNEEEINLNINPDGSMDLPKFENITEDKFIRAEFGNNVGYVKVNHYKKDTNEKLAESETLVGNYRDNYTTSPAIIKGYELERNVAGDFVKPTNATGTFTTDDIEVNYYYQPKQVDVITSYELENGTKIIPDSTQKVEYGKNYTTVPGVVDNKYELVTSPDNSNGKISSETPVTVRYIYKLKDAKVTVHHYIDGTTDKVPNNDGGVNEDQVIDGRVDDAYNTAAVTTIPANYKVVNTPVNAAGTMTVDSIEVTYFYKLKDATIENSNFEKTSPQVINNINQKFVYNIKYTGSVKDYIGKAVLEIVDTLPYKIDIDKSDLAGGEYDEEHKTIKWKILVNNINSFDNNGNVEIIKTFGVVYKDLPIGEHVNITNTANVKFSLKDVPEVVGVTNKEKEVETTTDGQFTRRITVNKTWVDDNNANGKRPVSIKYVLSGNNQTKEQVVTGNTNSDADWNYTFTNLPKYDAQGNEIVYTVDEQEVNAGDFKFYTKQVAGLNVTNTFTVPNDKIEVQVNKVWDDNSNANAKRPTSIKYVLSGNGLTKEQTVTGNTRSNEDWSYKFTDLPKYNAQGNEIVYTVAEQEAATDGLKFYTNEISGEYKTAITVKNKFTVPEDKVEVEVTKHWEDNNNANHRRPTSIKYVLKGNGLTKEQEVIGNATTDAGWNYKFTNLPKYNAQGNEITYTVEEQEVNANDLKFYTKEVNGFNVTNTFKVPEDKVNVIVTKTWVDSSNAKGKRPSSIKYILKGGATPIEKVVSGNNTTDENWSYTFENLAKYDSNGQEYQYNVEEEITENAHLYTKVITGNKESGFNVINTFKVPEDKLTIAVTKEWKDNSNVASKRPTSIKYVLKGGATPIEEVVSGNNTTDADWNHTFTNVAKYNDSGDEITYTLEEQEVSANDFKFYKKAISGDYKAGFNVANTFEVPNEKVEVQVNKVWEDDSNANTKRPASIKYILKGGATPVEQVVSGNTTSNADWSYKFTNLPKYSATGDEIQYTVEEQEVNTDELKFYEKEITGSMNSGFNIKNKFKVPDEKVEVQITKTWEDNSNVNGKRPVSIKYVLSGNGSTKEQTVTGNTTTNDNWSYTFANLPKYNAQGNEITYTVEEQEVNPGDLKFYNKQIAGFNVTNTFRIPDDKVKVEITKKWEDSSNVSNKRPASVKIELSDGANVVRTEELTGTGNEWKHTFTDLPKYNSQGNTITYTLDEKEVKPGDLQFYTKSIVGNTITNTFTQSTDKINVNVSKTWNDSNNANRKRPVSIKYVLKNKETVVSEKVVAGNETTDADWTHTFTGLAKYDEHNDEIKYTLEEQEANEGELKFYTKQVNGDYKAGFNVVNTFKVPDERINVRVSKTWNDDSNSRSKRPTSIKYIITDGQNTVEQIVTGESNTDTNWSYEFSNLVKYEANTGNEISYTVREEEVNPGDLKFYEPTISGDYKAGINVTNKFVVPNDKVTPRVTITWEDNNNNGNKRPSNVKIIVKDKEGKVVKEGNVTGNPTDEEWNKVFENVPKYDKDGNPIPYTVEEKPNSPDDFKFYKITVTGDIDKGYKVTNKFEVPDEKVTVKVKKVWEDSNNAASKRPTAIKVQLKNNAAIVREERVTGSGNEWTYTFENVSKYNGYGDVINYTVEEIEEQTEDLKFYEKKITGDKDSEYVITNKFKVPDEKIEINVNKTWEDNNNAANKRPTSIKYVLSGNNQTQEQVVSGNRTTDANWSYEFTNVKKYDNNANEIVYSVEEQEVNSNDLKFYTKKVSGEQTNGFAVVNKFTVPSEKVTVKVSKTWDDESNRANKRPASIKYEVLNSNNQIVASKVQIGNKNTADGWSHNFELDKYDALGNEEVYNVQEVEVNQNDFKFYRATVSGNYKSGFTVTNKFEVPNEEVTPKISVEWKDNSNQNNKRPTSVKIQVKDEEGRIVKESPVTGLITEESWKKIFENVPKYNKNGDPINYTITEEPNNPNDLEFYTTTTSGNITNGFKVVNTYAVPGTTISLKANKKWLDGNNAKNKRPASIKIEVRNNNEVVADKEVKGNRTTDANWEVEFKNLPKYNPTTGAENVYTVTETEVHQGELRYYTSVVNGNTITNTIKPVTEGKIEDSKVEKESTLAKITKADEIVPYTITYKGKIKEYMGDAVVKIVDELPFKLDLSKSNIMDGSYDDESKTITWTENLNNIDTHSNGDKEVEIKKEIKLVYKDLKISEENLKVTNKVRAEISLKELNKKITENNTKEIPAEISSKVTVKYVLKSNRSMKLKEDKVITGHVGDAYQTTIPNDIDQDAYEFVEVEGNENGKISQEEKVVTYLYKKKFGKVVVSYVEKSTGMKLQNDEVIKGNINEPYNAEGKEIEYYNLVSTEKSENAKPVITEDEQKITHYYAKKVFNIEIDKELKEATIDGEKRTFRNGKFTKLDIPVKKILNSEVKVRYSINVRNTGEIKGSTVIQENIPKYFTMNPTENPDWRIENGKIVSKEIDLNQGESKELSITLKWTNSKDNFGTLVNKAGIEKTKNNAGFEETDTEEEKKGKKQQATLVLVPKTGLDINKLLQMTGVGITLTALVAAMGYTISRKVRE